MTDDSFQSMLNRLGLPTQLADFNDSVYEPLLQWVLKRSPGILGIQGTQGSGKSTLAQLLQARLQSKGLSVAILSLDDLYLDKQSRQQLAQQVHPLFSTRGVPGTHDTELGCAVLDWVKNGHGPISLPRFDKSQDDRSPTSQWPQLPEPPDMLIFEGWCLGVPAQAQAQLSSPINRLETEEDPDGLWRSYANQCLEAYQRRLFNHLDALIVLQAPSFDQVFHWRRKQEEALRQSRQGAGVMNDAELERFIQHYERLTRHALVELPQLADVVIPLNAHQEPGAPIWRSSEGQKQ
ncbi:MAG: hypothetical protein LAT65_13510 [Saccharospirillum sp.]|nr:hypothetical protein [Saccharospirillum sp.]